jgi:hypothetical protein
MALYVEKNILHKGSKQTSELWNLNVAICFQDFEQAFKMLNKKHEKR